MSEKALAAVKQGLAEKRTVEELTQPTLTKDQIAHLLDLQANILRGVTTIIEMNKTLEALKILDASADDLNRLATILRFAE